ncbi:hypothetical protein Tcan_08444 [Toxocara canis]|uniref:Uncharacterized protein n=1 Tax=Toxocara canis TaxID=6265 RepID=A0A0B2VSQ4_TOXCA|nr:hypothetical protein Tcan_08444 [Toxocara canis]
MEQVLDEHNYAYTWDEFDKQFHRLLGIDYHQIDSVMSNTADSVAEKSVGTEVKSGSTRISLLPSRRDDIIERRKSSCEGRLTVDERAVDVGCEGVRAECLIEDARDTFRYETDSKPTKLLYVGNSRNPCKGDKLIIVKRNARVNSVDLHEYEMQPQKSTKKPRRADEELYEELWKYAMCEINGKSMKDLQECTIEYQGRFNLKRRLMETEDKHEKRLQCASIYRKMRSVCEQQREKNRIRQAKKRLNESAERREKRLQQLRAYARTHFRTKYRKTKQPAEMGNVVLSNESPSQYDSTAIVANSVEWPPNDVKEAKKNPDFERIENLKARLSHTYRSKQIRDETDEQREARLARYRRYQHERLLRETPEQRARRLEVLRRNYHRRKRMQRRMVQEDDHQHSQHNREVAVKRELEQKDSGFEVSLLHEKRQTTVTRAANRHSGNGNGLKETAEVAYIDNPTTSVECGTKRTEARHTKYSGRKQGSLTRVEMICDWEKTRSEIIERHARGLERRRARLLLETPEQREKRLKQMREYVRKRREQQKAQRLMASNSTLKEVKREPVACDSEEPKAQPVKQQSDAILGRFIKTEIEEDSESPG